MTDHEQPMRITINTDGPYTVTGGVPLIERYPAMSTYGEPLAWDPVGAVDPYRPIEQEYDLCRCGHSQDKPYCDGSHRAEGFDGTLTADRGSSSSRQIEFEGHDVTMTDDEVLCAHAGFCGTRFTKVWQMLKRTNDPEVLKRLQEMVANCPSGRLEVRLKSETMPEEPTFERSIAVVPDGPLWVRGGIEVVADDGFIYEIRNRVTLCRCGQSRNKPFCDGTHEEINFKAPLREATV